MSLQKHPHVIFEARTTANKGCANSGNLEWRLNRRQKHVNGFVAAPGLPGMMDMAQLLPNGAPNGRYKRDVREAIKYIETAIVVDKAMFDKRNGSTRADVVHDAVQVANIADLVSAVVSSGYNGCGANGDNQKKTLQYFRTLNTRVSVVYIETWNTNQAQIDGGKDISKAISSFNDYTSRNLFKVDKDTTQLLT